MDQETIAKIAAYVAIAVPISIALGNFSKLVLEWLNQRHTLKLSVIQQNHQITTNYLDKALDPQVPLAIRHQLLRFLATPDAKGNRLSNWAAAELSRVGTIIDETNRAVVQAEQELHSAKTPIQLDAAEKKLVDAFKRQKSLMEPALQPEITATALRADMIADKKLNGLVMSNANLQGMQLLYRELRGADFSASDLTHANLQGCDLRSVNFHKSKLIETNFYAADARGADFTFADLTDADFHTARLEGASFTGAKLNGIDLRATYDDNTKWPRGFKPDKHGAVHVPKSDGQNVDQEK